MQQEKIESIGSKYNTVLGLPHNEKYSKIFYAQLEKMRKLHKGGFNSRKGIYVFDMEIEGQTKQTFVQKEKSTYVDLITEKTLVFVRFLGKKNKESEIRTDLEKIRMDSVLHDIKMINLLHKANIPTLEQAFIYKNCCLITSLAHNKDEFIVASNSKAGFKSSEIGLPLITVAGHKQLVNQYKKSLEINNFEDLLKDIFEKLVFNISEHWLQVGFDSIFFRMPLNVNSNKQIDIKWLVGDMDNVTHVPYLKPRLKHSFVNDLKKMVKYFVKSDLQAEYLWQINQYVRRGLLIN